MSSSFYFLLNQCGVLTFQTSSHSPDWFHCIYVNVTSITISYNYNGHEHEGVMMKEWFVMLVLSERKEPITCDTCTNKDFHSSLQNFIQRKGNRAFQ